MADYQYDWAWRKDVMAFEWLRREAVEICSPALYLRRLWAVSYIEEAYVHGLLPGIAGRNRSQEARLWMRLVDQAFVRAYLRERRAGLPPRDPPGPAAGANECVADAREVAQRLGEQRIAVRQQQDRLEREERERQRWRMFAAGWLSIGQLVLEDGSRP